MLRAVIGGLILLVGGGASAPPPFVAEPNDLPDDFSVDLTIVSDTDTDTEPDADSPAQLQPGRYVVFADGTLHHGIRDDDGPAAGWLPPITRSLRREQVEAVWALSCDLGLADPDSADPLENLNRVDVGAGRTVYLLALTADGRRWNFVQDAAPPAAESGPQARPDVAPLARALAELAWVPDGYEPPPLIVPRRYDFGPDPYAPYR